MTKLEELQERYEDALCALLLYQAASEEGKTAEAENRRLQDGQAYRISPREEKRYINTIKKQLMKEKRQPVGRIMVKTLNRIAIAAVICMILFISAFALSESVRIDTVDFIIENSQNQTEYSCVRTPDVGKDCCFSMRLLWLPKGYRFVSKNQLNRIVLYTYKNEAGNLLTVGVAEASVDDFDIGTAASLIETAQINNAVGQLKKSSWCTTLSWDNQAAEYHAVLFADALSTEDILHVAEEMDVWKEKDN